MPTVERRNRPRLPREEVLYVQVAAATAPTGARVMRCTSRDMSGFGLRLRLGEALPPGTPVDLWVRLVEHAASFYLHGVVRWYSAADAEAGIGIGFVEGSDCWQWLAVSET